MNVSKLIIFPDGTRYSTTERLRDSWAIIAAPIDPDDIRQDARQRASRALSEAVKLEAAIAAPEFHSEESSSSNGSESLYSRAYLTGTQAHILVDGENLVVEEDLDRADQASELMVRTGVSVPDAVLRNASERLVRLRKDEADYALRAEPGSSIEEMPWRVLRWCRDESKARELISKLEARPMVSGTMSIVIATTVAL